MIGLRVNSWNNQGGCVNIDVESRSKENPCFENGVLGSYTGTTRIGIVPLWFKIRNSGLRRIIIKKKKRWSQLSNLESLTYNIPRICAHQKFSPLTWEPSTRKTWTTKEIDIISLHCLLRFLGWMMRSYIDPPIWDCTRLVYNPFRSARVEERKPRAMGWRHRG